MAARAASCPTSPVPARPTSGLSKEPARSPDPARRREELEHLPTSGLRAKGVAVLQAGGGRGSSAPVLRAGGSAAERVAGEESQRGERGRMGCGASGASARGPTGKTPEAFCGID
jgi:hypothetical protein